jgi:hypothetical protein
MFGVGQELRNETLAFGDSLDLQRYGLGRLLQPLEALFYGLQQLRRQTAGDRLSTASPCGTNDCPTNDRKAQDYCETVNCFDDDARVHR